MSKIDLLPHLDFSLEEAINNARQINPQLDFISLSCKTGQGMDEWIEWLTARIDGKRLIGPCDAAPKRHGSRFTAGPAQTPRGLG